MSRIGIGVRRIKDNGLFSNALSTLFDGVDESANINAVRSALASTTVGTWSIWLKPVDATPAALEIPLSFGDTNANEHISLRMEIDGKVGAQNNVGGVGKWRFTTNAVAFSDNTWTHVALVHNGTEPKMYVNSILEPITYSVDADRATWFNANPGLDTGRIGALNFLSGGDQFHFNGNEDEPRFWNAALSAGQITMTYNGGVPLAPNSEPLQANLITDFRMGDSDIFPTITDSTGGNNGTLINMEAGDFVTDTP